MQSFSEAHKFPIISTVETISVKDVPFPAVTVNAGKVLNPWGFVEKMFRFVEFGCYDSPLDCPDKREAPRRDLRFFTNDVVTRFFEVVYEGLKYSDLEKLKQTNNEECRLLTDYTFPEFGKAVALMAAITSKKSSRAGAIRRKLAEATADTFAMFSVRDIGKSIGWGTEKFYPIVQQEAVWYEVNETVVAPCLERVQDCPDTYNQSYAALLLPFLFNRVPYEDLELGDYISYFTRRVLSVSHTKYNETKHFLSSGKSSKEELELAQFLLNITNKVDGQQTNIGINLFEMTKLLDRPANNPREAQAFEAGRSFGCVAEDTIRTWRRAWLNYLGMDNHLVITEDFSGQLEEPPCANGTISEILGIENCCVMTRGLKQGLEKVLILMKYAIQSPHFSQTIEEITWETDIASGLLQDYEIAPFNMSRFWNKNPRVYKCQYDQEPDTTLKMIYCDLFTRSYTNEGFGYTFNAGNFWKRHKESNEFNQMFHKIMFPFNKNHSNDKVIYPEAIGEIHGLSLALMLNKHEAADFEKEGKELPSIKLTIHDPKKPGDMQGTGVLVHPGYITTFLVTTSQVMSSEDIQRLEKGRRKCVFPFENDGMDIFSEYTQSACVFECMLKMAVEKCGCVPWNYPRFYLTTDVCDYLGVFCFEKVLKGVKYTT